MDTKLKLDLDDLRVESFDTLPELSKEEMDLVVGGMDESSSGCFSVCGTGCETVVCCYPSGSNKSGGTELE